MIRFLVERGADVDLPTSDGDMSLHIAAADGRCDVIDLLVELGAELDSLDFVGLTPLLRAIWHRNDKAACRLIEHGADIRCCDPCGNDAIDCIVFNDLEAASALLRSKLGVEFDEQRSATQQRYALVQAASDGRIEDVTNLLDHGVDVDSLTPEERSPLWMACHQDNLELVELLLDRGAKPDLPGQHNTPLMAAAEVTNRKIIAALIEAGADVLRSIDGKSWTAASFALHTDRYLADYLRHLERTEKRRRKRTAEKAAKKK
jgi:ankyrin repeat protein